MFGWISNSSLRRVITHGNYIPEVDGFRFLAILIVVLAHAWACFGSPAANRTLPLLFRREVINGKIGVYLFFTISGFILALPFARYRLLDARPVNISRYFKRRVTRLEPPYLLLMFVRFPLVLLYKHFQFKIFAAHLGASLLYLHNLIYGYSSTIYPAAWSLEIEVQFYILAPLLARVYCIRSHAARQLLLLALILGSALLSASLIAHGSRASYTILDYFQYFLAGFLLCDLYLTGNCLSLSPWVWDVVGVLSLSLILLSDGMFSSMAVPLAIISLYLAGFRGKAIRAIFSVPAFTIIGGMCYSLYLTHMLAITGTDFLVSHLHWMNDNPELASVFGITISVVFLLVLGTMYFRLIERPCMHPDWPARFVRVFTRPLHSPGQRPAPAQLGNRHPDSSAHLDILQS